MELQRKARRERNKFMRQENIYYSQNPKYESVIKLNKAVVLNAKPTVYSQQKKSSKTMMDDDEETTV